MANWCENILIVKGEKEDLKGFKKQFNGYPVIWPPEGSEAHGKTQEEVGELIRKKKEEILKRGPRPSFNALYPVPKFIISQGYDRLGYNWCNKNWGVKSDIYYMDIGIREEDDFIEYYFDTPWNPPEKWVENVSKMFPQLIFEIIYQEDGMCFCGRTVYEKGEKLESEYYQYGDEEYIPFMKKHFGEESLEFILENLG